MKKTLKFHLLMACLLLLIIFKPNLSFSQTPDTAFYRYQQIITDTLFNAKQIISILALPLPPSNQYSCDLFYSQHELKRTSTFAKEEDALLAINGSFFDMKKGGSVTYLEVNDSLISHAGPLQLPDSILNGVVLFTKNNKLRFAFKQPDSVYLKSRSERTVIGTGPLLIVDGIKVEIPGKKHFVTQRHPRTCLCTTTDSLLLITVDGRSNKASGMNLYELQDFLHDIHCTDAINLDGGGSTTMWIKGKGIMNNPSDSTGERPVANVILVKKLKH